MKTTNVGKCLPVFQDKKKPRIKYCVVSEEMKRRDERYKNRPKIDPKQQMEKTLKQVDDIKKKRDAQNEYRKKHGVNLK